MDNCRKKKILLVHNFYRIPGGEDSVFANEKKLLEDNGHSVVIYTRKNDEINSFSLFKKLFLPFSAFFNIKTYKDIKRIIIRENIDIVHVHNALHLISPAVYYAAFSCKKPVVQTVHNFRLICPGATLYRDGRICDDCIKHGLHCAVKHRCYRNSRSQTIVCVIGAYIHRLTGVYSKINYICLTEFNRKKLLTLKQIKPERAFVKPNFADVEHHVVPFEQRHNRFIFAGRIDKIKGVDILLESWKLMGKNAPELLICGTGPLDDWCRCYISENGLSTVKMAGFLPNEEVKKHIADSIALIMPTQWYEGFPMTVVEAYSVGTPVIGSDLGNVGDLIENGVSGVKFKFDSPQDLARTVLEFSKNPFPLPEEYLTKFSAEKNITVLENIYKEVSD